MKDKVRAWEAKILRRTPRSRTKPGETWADCRQRTAQSSRKSWRKMGLLLLKIWTPMTWAVYEGGERPRGGEAGLPGARGGTWLTLHVGSIKFDATIEDYSGTHRWQGGLAKGMLG